MRRDSRGSSLVEVMAVVTILALLASVVGVAVHGVFPRARNQAWSVSMKGLQGACDVFYALWGSYPVEGEQPVPGGPLASPLDLQAEGGDGRPFAARLRSLPSGDAVEAGLARDRARLYYGVNYLGRVFATTAPPPWSAETPVFLPEHPGGIPLFRVGIAPVPEGGGPTGGGSGGSGDQPGKDEGTDGRPGSGEGTGEQPGSGGAGVSQVVLAPGQVAPVLSTGVEERGGALVPTRGPTLSAHESLPVAVAGAGAAVLGGGLYLLGGQGNADRILYQPSPDEEWQLLPTRLPYDAGLATVASVGGKAYLLGGTTEAAGRGIWVYEGGAGSLRQLSCTFPAPLVGAAACGHEEKVYVFGGFLGGVRSAAVFVLDPETETLEQLPASLPMALVGAAATAVGDRIYLFGGETVGGWSDRILAFSPRTGAVEDTGHRLPVASARLAAAALEGVVYLLGGAFGDVRNPTPLNTVWSYVPDRGVTRLSPALSFGPGRWGAAAASWGGDVYFCGGASGPTVQMAQVVRFRWQEGRPRPVVTLDAQLYSLGAVAGRAGDIYVVGGTAAVVGTDQVRRVTLADGKVQILGFRLPRPVMNAPCVRVGNRIFVIGGRTMLGYVGERLNQVTVIDLDTGTVARAQSLPRGAEGMAATSFRGRVYVFGGLTDGGPTDRILEFDPVSYSLEELSIRLPSGRQQVAAASGPQGIWLVGGRAESGLLDEILLFDPVEGSLRQVARLPVPLERAAAVTWGDRLYVLGGMAPGGTSARVLEVDGEGTVRAMPCVLPTPACGVAVVLDGNMYLVEDGGVVLEVVPRPRMVWRMDSFPRLERICLLHR